MAGRYIAPKYGTTPFTCPHCETLANQTSGPLGQGGRVGWQSAGRGLFATTCGVCEQAAVWQMYRGLTPDQVSERAEILLNENRTPAPEEFPEQTLYRMIWPVKSNAPEPSPDLPDDVLADYQEAAAVLPHSARASAALLRLSLQRMCVHLGEPGQDINRDIGALVENGTIRPIIQKAMDTVRISGNESVHPGELDLNDDIELALALFDFINLVAEEAITQPAKVQAMYEQMPEAKRNGVAQRDGRAPTSSSPPTP